MARFGFRAFLAACLVLGGAWMLDALFAPPWWAELLCAPVVLLVAGWLCDVSARQAAAAAGVDPDAP